MKFVIAILIIATFICQLFTVSGNPPAIEKKDALEKIENHHDFPVLDYYWREYVGVIPPDALEGGIDKSGDTAYIGQAFFKEHGLLPATIYQGSAIARTTLIGKELHSDNYVKILCTSNKHLFRWSIVKDKEALHLSKCQVVVGGHEGKNMLAIGRVNFDREMIIGKVFMHPQEAYGLWIPHNCKEEHFLKYEILTYNCTHINSIEFDMNTLPHNE